MAQTAGSEASSANLGGAILAEKLWMSLAGHLHF